MTLISSQVVLYHHIPIVVMWGRVDFILYHHNITRLINIVVILGLVILILFLHKFHPIHNHSNIHTTSLLNAVRVLLILFPKYQQNQIKLQQPSLRIIQLALVPLEVLIVDHHLQMTNDCFYVNFKVLLYVLIFCFQQCKPYFLNAQYYF